FIRLATLALLSTLSFFSPGETILRLAYAENSQPVKDAWHFLGQQVEEKTGGDIKVQYFQDGQLGGERELVELTQVGVVDIT
ncbi:TRAP transporter substrate-binding protein DctP, partial [Salmonella enterica subsp. enterica serovar Infantis]